MRVRRLKKRKSEHCRFAKKFDLDEFYLNLLPMRLPGPKRASRDTLNQCSTSQPAQDIEMHIPTRVISPEHSSKRKCNTCAVPASRNVGSESNLLLDVAFCINAARSFRSSGELPIDCLLKTSKCIVECCVLHQRRAKLPPLGRIAYRSQSAQSHAYFLRVQILAALLDLRRQRTEKLPQLFRIAHRLQSVQRVADFLRFQILAALLDLRRQRREKLPQLRRVAHGSQPVQRGADCLRLHLVAMFQASKADCEKVCGVNWQLQPHLSGRV